MSSSQKRIVTIGGGTGNFTVLTGLKEYPHHLSAIVSMADNGGSTGVLRTELGVLPPGDVRQCLVALSRSSALLRELFTYRFEGGRFEGANMGNLFLSALEKITGDFDTAVQRAGEVLHIRGQVIPVITSDVALVATKKDGTKIVGESQIETTKIESDTILSLEPSAQINPRARTAIEKADLIIFCPGDLFTSLLPNILVSGVRQALIESKAKKVMVANLMTKPLHTAGFHVADFVRVLHTYLGAPLIDVVVYNTSVPDPGVISLYAHEGEEPVRTDEEGFLNTSFERIGVPLVSEQMTQVQNSHDELPRSLIRHDSVQLAKTLVEHFLS